MTRTRKPAEPTLAEYLVREALPPCKYFLSTGSTLLDLAISDRLPGGVGSGRTVQLIGDNSSGKTVIMKEILGSAQRQGGYAAEEEAEYTPDHQRAALFGLDVGKWKEEVLPTDIDLQKAIKLAPNYVYRNPTCIEDLFDNEIGQLVNLSNGKWATFKTKKNPKTGVTKTTTSFEDADTLQGPIAIGVDTFTALPSRAELERPLDQNSYNMERAKAMSAGFRKYVGPMGKQDITVVAVDHIRSSVTSGFGPDWTVSGGKAMQQYASTRIFFKTVGMLKNSHKLDIGAKIHFKVVKNKLAPPGREGDFYILFDYGVDDIRSNMEWLDAQDIETCLTKEKNTWFWKGEKLDGSFERSIRAIEDKDIDNDLQDEVARVWRILYEPTDRKRKHR